MANQLKRTAISISLFGETSVGKTCIVGVFIGLDFQEEHLSTIGIEKNNTVIDLETGERIKLKLWDTAGQERFHCVSLNSLKNSQASVIVFDLTNKESFDRVIDWLKQIREYSLKLPIGLFGNKSDLEGRKVTQEAVKSSSPSAEVSFSMLPSSLVHTAFMPAIIALSHWFSRR